MARKMWVQLAVAAFLAFFFVQPFLQGAPFMLGQAELPSYSWLIFGTAAFIVIGFFMGWWRLPTQKEEEEVGTPFAYVFEASKKYLYDAAKGQYYRDFMVHVLNADIAFRGRGKGARLIGAFPLRELRLDLSLLNSQGYNKANKMSRAECIAYICDECSDVEHHHPTDFSGHVLFLERKPTIRTLEQVKVAAAQEALREGNYEDIPALTRGGAYTMR